jgi:DNA polymerase I-like protein with 3'-5' exonuclease and polymerase domains
LADLVVIASLTNWRAMLDVFAQGGGLHKHTAAGVLDRPIASITDDERDIDKTLNFGCCYGGGIPMILARCDRLRREADGNQKGRVSVAVTG